jgi:hypothetical protein
MTDKKDDEYVLKVVSEALKSNKIEYSTHALERMDERDVTVFEVEEIIKYGERESGLDEYDKKYEYWRYVIRNKNVNDRDMAISVDIEDCPGTIIVTVMLVDPITGRSL